MFKRQRTGSVVCSSCGSLVGVNDDRCYSCGRRNPGLWGFAPALRAFGNDLGFVTVVIYGCSALYVISLLLTVMFRGDVMGGGSPFAILSPNPPTMLLLDAAAAARDSRDSRRADVQVRRRCADGRRCLSRRRSSPLGCPELVAGG